MHLSQQIGRQIKEQEAETFNKNFSKYTVLKLGGYPLSFSTLY